MAIAIACPDAEKFRELAGGVASAEEMEQFATHLEDCVACARRMDTVADQSVLVKALRESAPRETEDSLLAPLMDRLERLADPFTTAIPGDNTPAPSFADLSTDPGDAHAAMEADFRMLFAPAQSADEIGRLGSYRILKVLGAGGMGVVFEAEDTVLKRRVALKAMRPGFAASVSLRQRFLREAQAAAGVRHDHVVVVHQAGEESGIAFLAMELLEGETLEARLRRADHGGLSLAETLRMGREIADGLAAAHEHGLIHRDIKPNNIWLEGTRGKVKILDFGLARPVSPEDALTSAGIIVGTPAYMSPEQANGEKIDFRADLFSLGCVLYRMCTGIPAFPGSKTLQVLRAVVEDHPRAPCEIDPEVSNSLSTLVMRLLEKNRSKRPASARRVASELAAIAAKPVVTTPKPPPTRRTPWLAAALMLGGIAAIVLLTVIIIRNGNSAFEIDTDGNFEISAVGTKVRVHDPQTKRTFDLILGADEIEVVEIPDGFRFKTKEFRFEKNGKTFFRLRMAAMAVNPPTMPAADVNTYTNSLGMKFAPVPKGKAWLGGGSDKLADVEAELRYDFYLGIYEVTQGDWEKIMGNNPSFYSRNGKRKDAVKDISDEELARFPVAEVSWDDAKRFIANLNELDKNPDWVYRLPTRREWEYACRGGPMQNRSEGSFDFVLARPRNELLPANANFRHESSLGRPCKVGSYPPNRLGLYDMHGNEAEWTDDLVITDGVTRGYTMGGGYDCVAGKCRAGAVHGDRPTHVAGVGFRVARVPASEATVTLDLMNAIEKNDAARVKSILAKEP